MGSCRIAPGGKLVKAFKFFSVRNNQIAKKKKERNNQIANRTNCITTDKELPKNIIQVQISGISVAQKCSD